MVLAEAVLRLLSEWSASEAPTLLVIEDAQWSDRETLQVIEYLADNLADRPVVVVVTLRDGEPVPNSDFVNALLARRAIRPIDLSPLDRGSPKQWYASAAARRTWHRVSSTPLSRDATAFPFISRSCLRLLSATPSQQIVPSSR